jgi:pilus assembly protein Flp/PilA
VKHSGVARFKAFLAQESGATAVEYGLLTALIALALVSALTFMSGKMQNTFNEVSSNLN